MFDIVMGGRGGGGGGVWMNAAGASGVPGGGDTGAAAALLLPPAATATADVAALACTVLENRIQQLKVGRRGGCSCVRDHCHSGAVSSHWPSLLAMYDHVVAGS